ncbi:hypothetical protein BJ973_000536 [Actinoplanes tereljensis]|uniref:Uncharacterized protein n=1 Tax=Paractinoplanes tereljensis TaxID=571912 RepID=A0A919TUR4_9ACTN|nr:hypothetical protein [Actinoplanes tereljensis]GIF23106.1 hypothetical protein Ate02nite_58360 [Actinoplanes tereljensis]
MVFGEPLSDNEVLAVCALKLLDDRGAPGPADERVSRVRCGRPLAYPVPTEDLPPLLRRRAERRDDRYYGVLLAFDLDVLPSGERYSGARFDVTLADPGARAVQLASDGDEFGLVQGEAASAVALRAVSATRSRPGLLRRLGHRAGTPRAWTTGVQSGTFGWVYDDPHGATLLPRTYGMHALVEMPSAATDLSGLLTVQAETLDQTLMTEAVKFSEPITGAEPPSGAAVRLCLAADVVGYSRRRNIETEELQRDLVRVLSEARLAAGIAESAVHPQPQGDGQFTVLPVGIDESVVIPKMIAALQAALIDRDRGRTTDERMRLRVALHRGLVKETANGWVGAAAIAVHRLLDSPPLRAAIKDNPEAPYVLGLPDVLYHDVIVHAVEPPLPPDFRPITVELPEKDFTEHGWLMVGKAR